MSNFKAYTIILNIVGLVCWISLGLIVPSVALAIFTILFWGMTDLLKEGMLGCISYILFMVGWVGVGVMSYWAIIQFIIHYWF